jgi:hypothetical protein
LHGRCITVDRRRLVPVYDAADEAMKSRTSFRDPDEFPGGSGRIRIE